VVGDPRYRADPFGLGRKQMTPEPAGARMKLVSTEQELLDLRAGWERLLAAGAGATPFDTWWMTYRAWKLEPGSPRPFVLVSHDEKSGTIEGIFPLGSQRMRRGPFTWRLLGTIAPRRIDFVDVVALPENRDRAIAGFLRWLADHWRDWDEARLSPIRADAALVPGLQGCTPPPLVARLDEVSENLAVTFPPGAKGWEDACDGETRRGLRRTARRLERSGFVVRRVSDGYAIDRGLDALVRLHVRRRGELGQFSRIASADQGELEQLVVDAVGHGGDLWVMEHEGTAVAAQLTLRFGSKVSHYRLAYDSAFRNVSPGIGLLIAAIDDAIKTGATEYDFGFGTEEYKRRWANVRRPVYRARIANKHLGRLPRRLWSLADRGRRRLRRKDADSIN
jgi:CelD/BcsL family acetyltransferase involved in cellulose biosynthesis